MTTPLQKGFFVQCNLDEDHAKRLREAADVLEVPMAAIIREGVDYALTEYDEGRLDMGHPARRKRPRCAGCQAAIRGNSAYFRRSDGLMACTRGCVSAIDNRYGWKVVPVAK